MGLMDTSLEGIHARTIWIKFGFIRKISHPWSKFGLIWQGGSREEDQIYKQTLSDGKSHPSHCNILCQFSIELKKKKTQCSLNFLAIWQNFYNIVITDGVDGTNNYLSYLQHNCFWLDTEQNTS